MKVILLKDVPKVGRRYETKDVSEGYAANLLIPRGLAIAATASAVKSIGLEKAKTDGEQKIHDDLLMKNIATLDGKTITLKLKANEKGHLFAGIHKAELLPELEKQAGIQINSENLILEKPIKTAGEHTIDVKGVGKSAKFTLKIN
jgi:large subunit ribosomal protein L9